ncbi:MAG: SUF system Fe-S cluster assembly regulator [Myxococcales bacterium]|nr:SUF system Fe-S cluster assembly regulator [Myxococcales bacterium]
MLRIGKITDYGIVVATWLAGARELGPHSVRSVAVMTQVPQPTASKVLKQLTRAGLLSSVRGANGGYLLSRPATQISVVEVIEAFEGPIAVTECSGETRGICTHEARCGVRANWERINHAVYQALRDISLADMTRPLMTDLIHLLPQRPGNTPPRTKFPNWRGGKYHGKLC